MFRSLRTTLILPWLFVAVVCCAVAFQLHGLFKLGVDGEIGKVKEVVTASAEQIRREFSLYLSGFADVSADFNNPDRKRELLLLLDLVLARSYGVEGGFWSRQGQFIAYSFPTHDTVKRDVPKDEMERIVTLNERSLSTRMEQTARFDSAGEVLFIHAVPLESGLVIWTMSRAHVVAAAAFQKLTTGFVVLLTLMLAAGALNLWFLQRWGRQLSQIEESFARTEAKTVLPKTGLKELDRLVTAFNHQTESLSEAQLKSKVLSQKLARAERLTALGRMAAGLAHEIRNPIGAMRLQAENALAKNSPEIYEKGCGKILDSIGRIDDLLERLLTMVRLDRLSLKMTKIKPWLEEDLIRTTKTNIKVEVEPTDIEWLIDEQQLSRALHNLVTNAVQHTPANGWIKVKVWVENDSLIFEVEDSGPGVPEELKDKIFEPFVSSRSDGTGLGLSIAREIVEAHGGTLQCESGKGGARMKMQLPREGADLRH